MLLRSQTQLVELLTELASWRKELAVHAIGERAIDQVIDSLETLAGLTFFPQVRLEHCQFISPNSAKRARDLGIKLCMQPNFSLDSVMYRDRLTVQQIRENNPFRMLIDDVRFEPGNNLIFGSDGMPHGAQTALDSALFPPQPGQVLSLDEFVAGYCWPDLAPGSIEVQVDHRERCVRIEGVRLNPAA